MLFVNYTPPSTSNVANFAVRFRSFNTFKKDKIGIFDKMFVEHLTNMIPKI